MPLIQKTEKFNSCKNCIKLKRKKKKKPTEKIVNIHLGNLQVHRLQILKRKSGGENVRIHCVIIKIFLSYSI